ncbi:ABC transporter substrate-binding protein [Paenibacillus sp. 2TAB26]|uniref:ABC transporter substrate-binding protein n=1 Tax=Paenibacillus sp. 2TAB26 TaxID=3233005 RepID=UPI003F9D4D34
MKYLKIGSFMVLAMVLMVVMVACSGNNESTKGTVKNSETEAPSDNVRVVASEKGEITIPSNPSKVIGLSVVYPEFLQALGVTPIAVQNYHADFPSYLQEAFKDVQKMGIAETPDFEMILAAEPDLIIAPAWWSDKDYDQLTKIAPTVLLPQRDDWRDELKDIGKVLNKEDVANKVIQDLVDQEAAAKAKLDTLVGDETVMYMMIMPKSVVLYGENIDRGSFIHKTLGLNPIANFPQTEQSLSISLEKLPEYNPDHLIVQLDDENNEVIQQSYKDMLNSALWKNMKAVKNNQVYVMGGKEWFSLGMSPLANSYAIDAVLKVFESNEK